MKIKIDSVNINVEILSEINKDRDFLFLIHGFTGSANDWVEVASHLKKNINLIAIDLIGHGKSDSPSDVKYYFASAHSQQIKSVINYFTSKKVFILGYSMGGRAALNFAIDNPGMLKGLILESTSAGIQSETERKKRVENDNKLADFIESHSVEEFVNLWLEKEIFKTLKKLPGDKVQDLKIAKLKNSKIGLANSLKGFGTGVMPYLGNELSKLNFSVLLITGEEDEKFTAINKILVNNFPSAEHQIVDGTGHNIHFENTANFIQPLIHFINQF